MTEDKTPYSTTNQADVQPSGINSTQEDSVVIEDSAMTNDNLAQASAQEPQEQQEHIECVINPTSTSNNLHDEASSEQASAQESSEQACSVQDNATANDDESSSINQAYKELEEKYLRAYADFENVKKRLEREKNQALEYANERIASDLLPILDALASAKIAAKESPAIFEGITLVADNFLKILAKHGVTEIQTQGEFDPNIHECIMQVAHDELADGAIAQVMQVGYRYKERVLRPAMVAVVKNN